MARYRIPMSFMVRVLVVSSTAIVAVSLQLQHNREQVRCYSPGVEHRSLGEEFPGPCIQMPVTNCSKRVPPSIVYLGMPHSGSSSLSIQLNMHPELSYGQVKEHAFFTSAGPNWHQPNPGRAENYSRVDQFQFDERNSSTYREEFLVDCEIKKTFDGTPYTLYLGNEKTNCTNSSQNPLGCIFFHFHDPGRAAVEKVRGMLGPDVKFITMFRDPLDMVISQYPYPAEYAHVLEHHQWKTCYADSLSTWLEVFPKENFLFLDSDTYFQYPQATIDRILEFIDVSPKVYSEPELDSYGRRRHNLKKAEPLPAGLRKAFHTTASNQRCKKLLEQQTSMNFKWEDSDVPTVATSTDWESLVPTDTRFESMSTPDGCRCHEARRNYGANLTSLDDCKKECVDSKCAQIEYKTNGWCNTYAEHCIPILNCHGEWSVYRRAQVDDSYLIAEPDVATLKSGTHAEVSLKNILDKIEDY